MRYFLLFSTSTKDVSRLIISRRCQNLEAFLHHSLYIIRFNLLFLAAFSNVSFFFTFNSCFHFVYFCAQVFIMLEFLPCLSLNHLISERMKQTSKLLRNKRPFFLLPYCHAQRLILICFHLFAFFLLVLLFSVIQLLFTTFKELLVLNSDLFLSTKYLVACQ